MKIFFKDFLVQDTSSKKSVNAFYFFDPQMPGIGRIFGLITISGVGDFDKSRLAKFVWNGIQDTFREDKYKNDRVSEIKQAIEDSQRNLLELIKNDDSLKGGVDLDIGLVHYVGNLIYFGFYGNSKIFVYHDKQLTNLSDLLKENKVFVGSTELSHGDASILYYPDKEGIKLEDSGDLNFILNNLSSLYKDNKASSLIMSTTVDFDELPGYIDIIDTSSSVLDSEEKSKIDNETPEESPIEEVDDIDEDLNNEKDEDPEEVVTEENLDLKEGLKKEDGEVTDEDFLPQEENSIKDDSLEEELNLTEEVVSKEEDDLEDKIFEEDEIDISDENIIFSETDNENQNVSNENLENKGKLQVLFAKAKAFLLKVWEVLVKIIGKIIDFLSNLFNKLKLKIIDILNDKYGRKAWFKKLGAKFSQSRFSSIRSPEIHIGDYKEKNVRNKRIAISILVLVVTISLYFGYRSGKTLREEREISAEFNAFYIEVNDLIDKSKKEVSTNRGMAEETLAKAVKMIDENKYEEGSLNEGDMKLYKSLEGKILEISDELTRTVALTEDNGRISTFIDLKIKLGDKTNPTDIIIFEDRNKAEYLAITDKGNKKVFLVPLNDRNAITALPDTDKKINEPEFIDIGNTGIYVYDKKNGVVRSTFVDETLKTFKSFVSLTGVTETDLSSINVSEIAILTALDNVYLLDGTEGIVYKSNGSSGGYYGLPFEFITVSESNNDLTDFFASYSGYITSKSSPGLRRFLFSTNGDVSESSLPVSGLISELNNVTSGYTHGSLDDPVFLFDDKNKSFLKLENPNKSEGRHPGEFLLLQQYAYRGNQTDIFNDVKDFVADFSNRKLYIIDDKKILLVDVSE